MNTPPNPLDDRARMFRNVPFVMYAMFEHDSNARRSVTAMIARLHMEHPSVETWYLIVPPHMEAFAMRWARAMTFEQDRQIAPLFESITNTVERLHGVRIGVKVDLSLPPGEWFIGSQPDRAPYNDAPGLGGQPSQFAAAPSLGGLRNPQRIEILLARQASRNTNTRLTYYQRIIAEDNPIALAELHYAARLFNTRAAYVTPEMHASFRASRGNIVSIDESTRPEIHIEGNFDVSEWRQTLQTALFPHEYVNHSPETAEAIRESLRRAAAGVTANLEAQMMGIPAPAPHDRNWGK